MAERVRILVSTLDEGIDLVRALAVRGLSASLVDGGDGASVVVDLPHERTASLLCDLEPALAEWSADRARGTLHVVVGDEIRLVGGSVPVAG